MVKAEAIHMDQAAVLKCDTKNPLKEESSLSTIRDNLPTKNSDKFQRTSASDVAIETEHGENKRYEGHKQDNTLTPVVVDENSAKIFGSEDPHIFEYHHEDSSETNKRSIFEIRHHLHSFGNERPENNLQHKEVFHTQHQNKTVRKPTRFLPQLVEANKENSDDKNQENKKLTRTVNTNRKEKKSRQLYDYNNPKYLEQSRRTRRRKQSEVDIEVGLRLSRFVQQPYEGCVDKYSKKCQRRGLREGRSRRKNEVSTSSADNSPLSSSTEQINLSRPSNLRDYDEEQLRSYLWCRRGLRRRSISSSPPRVRTSDSSNFRETQSQSGSPLISPSPSAGPSSPASGRYRKTTFATILNSATKREEFQSRLHLKEGGFLPDIHKDNQKDSTPGLSSFDEILLSRSLPNSKTTSSLFRSRSGTFSEFRNHQLNANESLIMSKNEPHPAKKGKTLPIPAPSHTRPSPSTHRKQILMNTSVPCGSPTFQRALQGLHVPSEPPSDKSSVEIRRKPTVPKAHPPQQSRVRILSVGGKQKVLKRSPTSACGARPNIAGHHVSFGEKTVEHQLPHDDDYDDEIIDEMRDRLTSLNTDDAPPVMPSKSILKNRRRSIDDLDVGTKKGLAMYLKSKQRAAQFKRRNGQHVPH